MAVVVAEDQVSGSRNFKAGDRGSIYWQYPVSSNIFDLSVEAPVMGLFGRDNQCLGVPWEWLRQAEPQPKVQE